MYSLFTRHVYLPGENTPSRMARAYVGALIVLVIVAIAYYANKKPANREGFLDEMRYRPCNIGDDRTGCKGFTSGMPPSIETEAEGDFPCCGYIGVPP